VSLRVGLPPASQVTAAGQAQKPQPSSVEFAPLPAPTGPAPYRLSTAALDVAPASPRVFHAIGDSGGVLVPTYQQYVADAMVADLAAHPEVAFTYHVGDVVYFFGDEQLYTNQFYEPYVNYNRPIVAIPGNHDGAGSPSLAGFVENFCAATAHVDPAAEEYNRDTITQPNVYWTLDDPAVTIIGLYSNVPSGGVIEPDQQAWLVEEIREAPLDVPLIVALHHPPYSCDAMHGGSEKMGALLDDSFVSAGRWPSLVLSGHVHNYQRFTRTVHEGHECAYIVCGASGYHNTHSMASDATPGLQATADTVLDAFDSSQYGFLRLTVNGSTISGEYVGVSRDGSVTASVDIFTC